MTDDLAEDTADIGIQTAMPTELPEFEGIRPVGVISKLNGAGERITRGMHLGEKGVVVVEYEVSNVGHGRTAQGVKRVHTLSVLDIFELEGRAGQRILNGCRRAYKEQDDLRHGRGDLLGQWAGQAGYKMTPDGWTDSTGRVLELAEIRGTQIELAANDPSFDPVAVVYADGSRALWPDDFPDVAAGEAPPAAGEFVGDLQVREVLDGMTGDTLAVWTDEQESARLLQLEEQALAEEAAGNADALAELQAARGLKPDGSSLDDPFVGLPGDDGREIRPVNGEPIPNYENLTAKEVRDHLLAMTDRDAVFAVASWEEDHGGRKTIVEAAGRRAVELLG